jgi:hypothetical protein
MIVIINNQQWLIKDWICLVDIEDKEEVYLDTDNNLDGQEKE